MTDIKKIFCRSDLWSKISHMLIVQLETIPHKFTDVSLVCDVVVDVKPLAFPMKMNRYH